MIWLLGGYMWLYIHRIFEVYPILGELQLERCYMCFVLLCWLIAPNKVWPFNRMHLAVVFFGFAVLVAWMVSPFASDAKCTDVVESVFKIFVFYFLVVTTVRDDKGLRLLILLFLASVGMYMSHSLLEYCNGRYEWRMGISRMIGVDKTNNNPNTFASTLLFSLPLTLPFWSTRPSNNMKLLLVVYTLMAITCILLTGSRAGFVGLIAFGLLYLFSSSRRKAGFLLVGGVGCIAALALPGELQNRFLTLLDSSYGPGNAAVSASGRLDGLKFGLQLWMSSPLTGTGISSFAALTGREGQAHNLYGQVLGEMGLIGFTALIGLVLAFRSNALESRRFYRRHPEIEPDFAYYVSRAISMSVILLLLLGWSGHLMFRYNWLWFASFHVATLYCIRRKAASLARSTPRLPVWNGLRRRGSLATVAG